MADIQIGEFAYSTAVSKKFKSRHAELDALHTTAIDKSADEAMRRYVANLLHGWMNYLDGDEAVLVRRDGIEYSLSNGKQSRMSYSLFSPKIVYNFVDSPKESDSKRLRLIDFGRMTIEDRMHLTEQHPEIFLSSTISDCVLRDGVISPGLAYFFGLYRFDAGGYVPIRCSDDAIQPENYVSEMTMFELTQIMTSLTDDSDVISLTTGKRIGEVCIKCRRVDP